MNEQNANPLLINCGKHDCHGTTVMFFVAAICPLLVYDWLTGHMNNLNVCSFSHVRRKQTYTSGPERQKCHRSTSHLPHILPLPAPNKVLQMEPIFLFFLSPTSSTKKTMYVLQCVIMTAAQQQQQQHANECTVVWFVLKC